MYQTFYNHYHYSEHKRMTIPVNRSIDMGARHKTHPMKNHCGDHPCCIIDDANKTAPISNSNTSQIYNHKNGIDTQKLSSELDNRLIVKSGTINGMKTCCQFEMKPIEGESENQEWPPPNLFLSLCHQCDKTRAHKLDAVKFCFLNIIIIMTLISMTANQIKIISAAHIDATKAEESAPKVVPSKPSDEDSSLIKQSQVLSQPLDLIELQSKGRTRAENNLFQRLIRVKRTGTSDQRLADYEIQLMRRDRDRDRAKLAAVALAALNQASSTTNSSPDLSLLDDPSKKKKKKR